MNISLIIAAGLPSLILIGYICFKDKNNPEPTSQLLKAFIFGCLSTSASLLISTPLTRIGVVPTAPVTIGDHFKVAFFGAGLPEECAKLFMLWLLVRKNPYFDEHFDGIVYAVCIGMGFAFVENIGYLLQAGDYWMSAGISRGFISVPGHYAFAVLMGYWYSLYYFGKRHKFRNRVLMLAVPIIAHGLFDWVLMVSDASSRPGVSAILTVVFLYGFLKMQKFCQRKLEKHLKNDILPTHTQRF